MVRVPISISTSSALVNHLFSQDFSDVKLVCNDGETIYAHKIILAGTCPYFKSLFKGPWNGNQSDEVHLEFPSGVVKTVLTVLYGSLDCDSEIQAAPLSFVGIASYLRLEHLQQVAETYCSKSINSANFKECWQAACLHNSAVLKKACLDFAKTNALELLTSNAIASLENEDPASWKEFSEGLHALED